MAAGGALIGGVMGAVGGGMAGKSLMEKITESMFDLPKTAAEENAYRYLGIQRQAQTADVNRAYHQKALQCHPDRDGGSTERFLELRLHMQVIRMARGYEF